MSDQAEQAQQRIDGFPLTDRTIKLSGEISVPDDVYDHLQLGATLRIVCEAAVTKRGDVLERDRWGDDGVQRRYGVTLTETRSAKLIDQETGEV